jgi:cytochrome o ubiquinol oxidase operon protein cyoD
VGVCALVFIAIVVVGSLWVLHNMNAYMMPGMGHG